MQMSSQISLSNAFRSTKSKEFNLRGIEVNVGKEDQPWSKRAHIGNLFELPQIVNSINNIDWCEMRSGKELGVNLVVLTVGLDLRTNKIRWISSFQSMR